VAEHRAERRLTAILAADIVGYSRLMAADEAGTLASLKSHRSEVFEPKAAEYRGRVVKLMGDGTLMEFGSVVDAVAFALDVQRTLARRNADVPESRLTAYRIGINIGDIIVDGEDIYGDGVNVAARLEALAPPGGICISGGVHDQVKRKLETAFLPLGPQSLKNLVEPVEVWAWSPDGVFATTVPAERLALPDKPSIAVLPFANMSADPEQEYFADGITEDIITGLSRCGWLFVIARNSTFRYRGTATDVRTVGKELGVRYVLEGSVRRSGARVRITSQLIEAENGTHLWADRHDRELADIFDLQDEITQGVVAALEPTLKKAEIERVRRKRPDDLGAYDLYLRAVQQMYDVRPEGRVAALEFVARALAIDPNYAEAHGVAAWCYFRRSLWEGSLPAPHREAMLRHARAVQELNSEDASTLAHAAIALALATHDYETALAMIERALGSNPNSAHAHGHGSVINTWAGNYDKSIELSDRALRLSPFDPLRVMPLAGQAGARMMKGDYEGAVTYAKRAMQVYPTHSPSFLIMIASLVRLERVEQAQAMARRMLEVSPSYRIIPNAPVLEHFVPELREAGLPG
jgi:TolB-like protein/Tfp pilus assembly protein PilF